MLFIKKLDQEGSVQTLPILLVVFAVGIISYLLITSYAPFNGGIFNNLFPKSNSSAATATNTSYGMKVLVLKYFPLTTDGQNIDTAVTGDVGDSYQIIHQKTVDIDNNLLIFLAKGTSYQGYKDPTAQPSLTYQIVDTKEFTQAVPFDPNTRKPLYNQILTNNNICNYIQTQGVSEVWLWAYQGPNFPGATNPYLNISESKMSGPFGDISNSDRLNDMPQCGKTYRVYTFNYGRGTAEAIHSWGHQIESEFDAVNSNVFRGLWQGPNYPQTLGVSGRCGSIHNPPNARTEYDWDNQTPQNSDCMDWNPDGVGSLSQISCLNWGCQDVSDNNNPQLNYIVWNLQNIPGRNNNKAYQGQLMRNWWDIHGNFDQVMGSDKTLFLSTASTPPASSTPEPSPSPIPSPSPTQIPTPTVKPTPVPTQSPRPTPSPTPISSPSPTPIPQGSLITIIAGGQSGVFNKQTIKPTMVLQISGINKQTWTNVGGNGPAGQFLTFTYISPTKVTHDQVRVMFTNDIWSLFTKQDVNLFIQKITIDGTDFQSNAPSVFSIGGWTRTTGCFPGKKQTIQLACNGFFQY